MQSVLDYRDLAPYIYVISPTSTFNDLHRHALIDDVQGERGKKISISLVILAIEPIL